MSERLSQGNTKLCVKGIIFDVDGTLADSVGFFYEIACEVLELAGLPPVPREQVYELMQVGDTSPLEKLFRPDYPNTAETLRRIFDDHMARWLHRYHHETEAIPGSLDLLHQLYQKGVLLGIATSSGRELPFLDRWRVRHLFHGIVGREDVEIRKPHPEPIQKCLGHLRLVPREVLYIGDSPIDIRAGKAAGTHTAGVLTGTSTYEVMQAQEPDHILPSVAELLQILDMEQL
jgi:HAD superfamily hydrolase (TIGR01509 family)